ncbi:unnamed protein product [Caenorhabditis angaria]|uniref:Uncharacterized protein n=1 Tax=Caenorhabditis angaria TaxID=860376 RepID=A0A9P1IY84_9PELO|nr:unnamed protein product [Caenorhabditis angaria]
MIFSSDQLCTRLRRIQKSPAPSNKQEIEQLLSSVNDLKSYNHLLWRTIDSVLKSSRDNSNFVRYLAECGHFQSFDLLNSLLDLPRS